MGPVAGYLTSTAAVDLDHLPESMLVIGRGYVAMLVRSQLTRREEPAIAESICEAFGRHGISVLQHTVPREGW